MRRSGGSQRSPSALHVPLLLFLLLLHLGYAASLLLRPSQRPSLTAATGDRAAFLSMLLGPRALKLTNPFGSAAARTAALAAGRYPHVIQRRGVVLRMMNKPETVGDV